MPPPRSVVITGVSRGLGAALFAELNARNDRILALGRHFTADQHAAANAQPDRIRLRPTDLADLDSLPDATELVTWIGDAPEVVLLHNAAVFEPFAPVGQLDPAQLRTAVAVNLTAPMLLTNALFAAKPPPSDTPQAGGRRITMLLVSSSAAHHVGGGRSVYGATKRAAEWFLRTLQVERHTDPNVWVTIVDPGIMDTGMQATVREHAQGDGYFPGRERFLDRYAEELPSPESVARRIVAEHLG